MKNTLLTLLLCTSMFVACCEANQDSDTNMPPADEFIPHGDTDEQRFGIYTVRTYRTPDGDGSFEILKSGQTIYGQHGLKFEIGDRGSICSDSELNLIGGDLTGNGKANLVIYEWSGGAHCCFTMFLFQIDDEFKKIAEINGIDSVPEFTDIDGDSVPGGIKGVRYIFNPGQ